MSVKPQRPPQQGHRRPHALRNVTRAGAWLARREREASLAAIVLHVLRHGNLHIVTVQLGGGAIDKGMELVTADARDHWEVRVLGFGQPAAWEAGLRDLQLAPVGHDHPLRVGERLIPVDEVA